MTITGNDISLGNIGGAAARGQWRDQRHRGDGRPDAGSITPTGTTYNQNQVT
ncbi:MAG: hypothetical protein IPM03_22180 [Sulfuritalea sp.]|nr:hypothetical protein [Sulfuritalea sp.]